MSPWSNLGLISPPQNLLVQLHLQNLLYHVKEHIYEFLGLQHGNFWRFTVLSIASIYYPSEAYTASYYHLPLLCVFEETFSDKEQPDFLVLQLFP